MEKNTKILLGLGAVIAAYLILKPTIRFGHYQSKNDISEGDETLKLQEELARKPIISAPVLPSEPVAVIPVQPAPVPVEQFPVETAPFEPLPIFTNTIDDFINPVVPFEPTPLPVEQFPFEPTPFESTPIFTNPIDNFINPIVPFEPAPIEVEKYVTIGNAINDSTALGAFHRDSRIGQIRSYATNIINSDKIKNGSKIRIYKLITNKMIKIGNEKKNNEKY